MPSEKECETVLGLDLSARARLAYGLWREGTCQYLCAVCGETGSSLWLRAHLRAQHGTTSKIHRACYGSARISADHVSCRLCGRDAPKILFEYASLSVHLNQKHSGYTLWKYFKDHVYAEFRGPTNPVSERESIIRKWQQEAGGRCIKDPLKSKHPSTKKKSSAKQPAGIQGQAVKGTGENKRVPSTDELSNPRSEKAVVAAQVGNLCAYACKVCPFTATALTQMTKHSKLEHPPTSVGDVRRKHCTTYRRIRTVLTKCVVCNARIACDRKLIGDHINHKHGLGMKTYLDLVSKASEQ